jgi:hypothetical protein
VAAKQVLLRHVDPAGQHRVLAPVPHGVVPLGQPQMPLFLLRHATPDLQQDVPQGVSPGQQQVTVAGSEQVSFLGQQPCPQNVLMLGSHPHLPVLAFTQMSPDWQQLGPQGVVPALHAHWLLDGFKHAVFGGQQVSPHDVNPGWQSIWASPRKGRSTVAAVAAAAAPPIIFKMPRRETSLADARASRSKRSIMNPPSWHLRRQVLHT